MQVFLTEISFQVFGWAFVTLLCCGVVEALKGIVSLYDFLLYALICIQHVSRKQWSEATSVLVSSSDTSDESGFKVRDHFLRNDINQFFKSCCDIMER